MRKQRSSESIARVSRLKIIIRVRKKLLANSSVECQVNELISLATDPKNLCRMFAGWQGTASISLPIAWF